MFKEFRKRNKLTQDDVAKALNVSRATYNGYELGKYEPNIASLKILSELFNVSLDELLGRDTNLINLACLDAKTQEAIKQVMGLTGNQLDLVSQFIDALKK